MPSHAIEEIVDLGVFWAGDTGPAIPIVLANTQGGYLNGARLTITGFIRRYDPRRRSPVGSIVSDCAITPVDAARGLFLFDWLQSSAGSVPVDPGPYILQLDLLAPTGQEQLSQRAVFRVLSTSPRPA